MKKHPSRLNKGSVETRNLFIDKLHEYFVLRVNPRSVTNRSSTKTPNISSEKCETVTHEPEEESEDESEDDSQSDEDYEPPVKQTRKIIQSDFASGIVASTLDRAGVSIRSATMVVSALASAFGMDIERLPCSRDTLRRMRNKARAELAKNIANNIDKTHLCTIHWDGKIMNNLKGNGKCDRLAVIVTGTDGEKQLLGVPDMPSGTGNFYDFSLIRAFFAGLKFLSRRALFVLFLIYTRPAFPRKLSFKIFL